MLMGFPSEFRGSIKQIIVKLIPGEDGYRLAPEFASKEMVQDHWLTPTQFARVRSTQLVEEQHAFALGGPNVRHILRCITLSPYCQSSIIGAHDVVFKAIQLTFFKRNAMQDPLTIEALTPFPPACFAIIVTLVCHLC